MKKHFVSIFLALMAMTAFSQTKKTWTIMPEMIGEHSYEDAVNWRDEGDPDYKEEADLATIYEGLEPYLATELNQRLVDFVYRKKMDDADIIVKVTIRKSENGSKNVYVATLNEGKVPKTGPVTYMSEELDPRTVAKSLAEKLCPTPVPGTISLFRVDGEAHVFWSDAKTDVKNDTLEYMIVRSPVKGSLTDKKTAIDLARKEKEEWKTNSEGGRFTESIHLNEESSKQCYFSVVVRNSLGCYSVYPVKGGQRITISTNLEGTIIFQTADPRFEEIQYEVDISSDANANIMLSEGAWKAKIQYYEGFDSEYKEFEVFSDNASKVIIQFDDVSEDYIESKYKRGMELKEKRRSDEAIKTLAVAADNQTFPHAEAMYQLGCIYEEKKDMEKAVDYWTKSKNLGNTNAKEKLITYYLNIAYEYKYSLYGEEGKKWDKAISELEMLISYSDPRYEDYRKIKGDHYDYRSKRRKEDEWEDFLETQRHRTTFSLCWGFPHEIWQFGTETTVNHQPGLVMCGTIEATFGVWPNVFIGISGVFNGFNDEDYLGASDEKYYDWSRNSVLGYIGLNYTIWNHINLFALVGVGGAFTSYADNSVTFSWVDWQYRAGLGFDWWFVYDEYDDWAFFDKIGMTFEYDVDHFQGEPWNNLEGCFKLGFTFFWDTKGISGFMPSFYNY